MSFLDVDLSIGEPEPAQAPPRDFGIPTPADSPASFELELANPEMVRGLLTSVGIGAGYVLRDPDVPAHWRFTADELDQLTPALTRIVNRTPKLLEIVKRGDELIVGVTLAGYVGRNVADGSAARKAREENDGQQPQSPNDGRPVVVGNGLVRQPGVTPAGSDGGGAASADGWADPRGVVQ